MHTNENFNSIKQTKLTHTKRRTSPVSTHQIDLATSKNSFTKKKPWKSRNFSGKRPEKRRASGRGRRGRVVSRAVLARLHIAALSLHLRDEENSSARFPDRGMRSLRLRGWGVWLFRSEKPANDAKLLMSFPCRGAPRRRR